MSEATVYEYAVIRVVPRVEREEFVNVGVALFCRKQRYAAVKYYINRDKIVALYNEADIDLIESHLNSFQRICAGENGAGKIAELDQAERFRWLTANRSTIIQSSVLHVGMCVNAEETHQELLEKLVL